MSERPQPLRAAIVGGGYIARVHAAGLRRLGVRLDLLVGREPERTRQQAARLGAARWSTDLSAALSEPAIDLVHICTPNYLHVEQAAAVLAAGKHLLCEKPLTLTSTDAAALVSARRPGQVAAVAYCYRYYALIQQLRQRVEAGQFGTLHHIGGAYLADELVLPTDGGWGVMAAYAGPSLAMADVGIHWCDLAEYVTGQRITRVMADLQTAVPERLWDPERHAAWPPPPDASPVPGSPLRRFAVAGEDSLNLLVRFEGGAQGAVRVSRVCHGRKNWIQLDLEGSEAAAGWNQEEADRLWLRSRQGGSTLLQREPDETGQAPFSFLPAGHPEGYQDAFTNLLSNVYRAVGASRRGEAPPADYPGLEAGARGVRLMEAVAASARAEQWISLE